MYNVYMHLLQLKKDSWPLFRFSCFCVYVCHMLAQVPVIFWHVSVHLLAQWVKCCGWWIFIEFKLYYGSGESLLYFWRWITVDLLHLHAHTCCCPVTNNTVPILTYALSWLLLS